MAHHPMEIDFIVSENQADLRLDRLIARAVPRISRSRAAHMVSLGTILVDGMKRRPGYRVRPGGRISGRLEENPVFEKPMPEAMMLDVVHEDDHLVLINKPPGMVVHPGPGNFSDTLVNGLLDHVPGISSLGADPLRPGIVHRLDKDTSGLILVAKTARSLEFLQKEFKQRRVKKEYLALAQGNDIPDQGEIELPIGRHPVKRKLMAVVPGAGKYARTGFIVKQRFRGAVLTAVRLYTGRTHQIRVHFYHRGMPLLGDRVYQTRTRRRNKSLAPRQMLHSWRLGFRHPFSGVRLEFEAPLPDDFKGVVSLLEKA